jgi:protein-tyrosine phosphatase/nicotinamidase-related amidase
MGPLTAHAPTPNRLHVGRPEALRLLGADPTVGPVAQLVRWARAQASDDLAIIHLRDWHDPTDAAQRPHLARFGAHCVAGTPGAELVAGLDAQVLSRDNEHFVDCLTLNDFVDTGLTELLEPLLADGPVRVGVVGVWTDAKVSFLLYELASRLGLPELATCSALTASASRTQHLNALGQLQRLLGVHVFDSLGDFAHWLVPEGPGVEVPPLPPGVGPAVSGGTLSLEDTDVVAGLFRESAEVSLHPLSGGFSGASVFRVRSTNALGHEEAPTVLKLGSRALIAHERAAFERVEGVLGNHAPTVRGFVEHGARAGLRYAYAAMGSGGVTPFKALYESGASHDRVVAVLEAVFGEILARFYRAARYERLPLLSHYGFLPKYAASVAQNVAAVVGAEAAAGATLTFAGRTLPNVTRFYSEVLPALPADADAGFHFVSYVHGDLNGANVLVDGRDNVWVIDFFHTDLGHVLQDLIKLENDLLYIFTPVRAETFDQALILTDALRAVADLRAALPETLPGVVCPQLSRAWRTVRLLRGFMATLCREDRAPTQVSIGLLRYAAHTMSFDESDPWQKRWALAAACGHAEDVSRVYSQATGLRVDWLPGGAVGGSADAPRAYAGQLGLTLCPGRRDRGRDLQRDLDDLVAAGVSTVVTLVTHTELEWAGVPTLGSAVQARGLRWRHAPIPDQGVPTVAEAQALVQAVRAELRAGRRVLLHCMGGLGRTGLVAACVLVAEGVAPQAAIAAVRTVRGPRAVESAAQLAFVSAFLGAPLAV